MNTMMQEDYEQFRQFDDFHNWSRKRALKVFTALLLAFFFILPQTVLADIFEDGVIGEETFFTEDSWDGIVPAVEEELDFAEALAQMIDHGTLEMPEKGKVPSKFPEYSSEEEILGYLKENYPDTRNQTTGRVHYGCCWAHAAAALAEFYGIRHGLSDLDGPMDRNVNYSELQLAYFSYHQIPEPISGETGDSVTLWLDSGKGRNFLNFGGNLRYAAQSLMRGVGFVRDAGAAAYKKAKKVLQKGLNEKYASDQNVICLKNAMMVNLWQNPKLVKQAIMANGAVGITFNYKKKYMNRRTNAYYNGVKSHFNHVAVIVGWDDSYPAGNFKNQPEADGAWLVRNSHSTKTAFSKGSYFWISYYDTSLGTAAYVYEMADQERGEVYDNRYYYDGQLHSIRNAVSLKSANVFTAVRKEEVLKAVQFDTTCDAPGKYRVSVYKNLEDRENPESGGLVSESMTTGTLAFAGYYTIPLNAPVELSRGETFSVVVETETPIDRECDAFWKEQLAMDTTLHEKESFSFVDGEWRDLSLDTADGTRGNLCIRALTDTVKWIPNLDAGTHLNIHIGLPQNIKNIKNRFP